MERVRSVSVTITVDTNKKTYSTTLQPDEDETNDEFLKRIGDELAQLTEVG